jgi:hypothetical protein
LLQLREGRQRAHELKPLQHKVQAHFLISLRIKQHAQEARG